MRTLGDIVDSVKHDGAVTHDELRYALLAMDALAGMDFHFIIDLPDEPGRQRHLRMFAEESFQRRKRAFDANPQVWLGWRNDPANPEYQQERQLATKIVEKFLAEPGPIK